MGSGPSRTIEWGSLEEHPYIRRIIDGKVTGADPLWNQLLSFRVPLQARGRNFGNFFLVNYLI